MSNYGTYLTDASQSFVKPDTGVTYSWNRTSVFHDGMQLFKTDDELNKYGMYALGNDLFINGNLTARRSDTSGVTDDGEDVKFGNAVLKSRVKCINITLADYNMLLAGGTIAGYKKLDPWTMYNIVDDVQTAEDVYVDIDGDHYTIDGVDYYDRQEIYPLYNNLQGAQAINPHELTDATFLEVDPPQLGIFDPQFRAAPGEYVELTYMVDTHLCARNKHDSIGSVNGQSQTHYTFTVIVRDSNDRVVYTNTTYAGVFRIKIGPFLDDPDDPDSYTTGMTWYSVEVIDWRGCGSWVQFVDVLFEPDVEKRMYNMTAEDLTTYGITPAVFDSAGNVISGDDKITGYKNKVGFTRLFADIAENYDGIVLYNYPQPSRGILYYIDYHKNLSADSTTNLGSQRFYIYHVNDNHVIDFIQELVGGRTISIHETSTVAYTGNSDIIGETHLIPEGKYTIPAGTDIVDWIMHDTAYLCRDGGASNSKIWVFWKWYDDEPGEDAAAFNPATQHSRWDEGKHQHYVNYLRVFNKSKITNTDNLKLFPKGYYYVVDNTARFDENVVFPDNFTVDFNGATWKGVLCFDIDGGNLVYLPGNTNTHIKNGKLIGLYERLREMKFDGYRYGGFIRMVMTHPYTPIAEGLDNSVFYGVHHCTFENMESRDSMGYDNRVRGGLQGQTGSIAVGSSSSNIRMDALGYIGYDGVKHDVANNLLWLLPSTSAEFDPKYDSDGNLITPDFVYSEQVAVSLVHNSVKLAFTPKSGPKGSSDKQSWDDCMVNPSYTGYDGKRNEVFLSFYKDGQFIKTIKTRPAVLFKKPSEANQITISGYGLSRIENGVRVSLLVNGHNAAFNNMKIGPVDLSKNMLFKNCYFHDTRSTAYSTEATNCVTYDGCVYDRIADVPRVNWFVSKALGFNEDGRDKVNVSTIKNCTFLHTSTRENGKPAYGSWDVEFQNARNFGFFSSTGLYCVEQSMDNVYVKDSIFDTLVVGRQRRVPVTNALYFNSTMLNTLNTTSQMVSTVKLSTNRNEEPVDTLVAVDNVHAASVSSGGSHHFRHSKISNTAYK